MSKIFEMAAEEWGDTNTIKYWVSGYTQLSKGLFSNKNELMEIFRGIADDYFSEKAEVSDEPRTIQEWAKVLDDLCKKDEEEK
jgi:hypothetical protein